VNPGGTQWLAGDAALLDGFGWAEYLASQAFYRHTSIKRRITDMDGKCVYRKEPEPSPVPTPRPSIPPGAPQPTAAPTGAQAVVEVQAAVVLTGVDPAAFNADPNQQEAFAQSILAHLPTSLAGAEVTDVVAAAARRRRLQASVAVSYTIVVRQDAAAVTDAGASLLGAITTTLSAAVSSGDFLDTLVAEAAAAGSSAAIAFQSISVDEAATLASIAGATITLQITTPAPVAASPHRKEKDAGLSVTTIILLAGAVVVFLLGAGGAFVFVRKGGPAKVAALVAPPKRRKRRGPLVDFSKFYWPCCPPRVPVDHEAGLVDVPPFGSEDANSVSRHVGYDLVDEYVQIVRAKHNAWKRYENVLFRIVKVQVVEGLYYKRWAAAVDEAEIDENWPRVVVAEREMRQEVFAERRTMALLGYGDPYTRVSHSADPPSGIKTKKVERRVEICSVMAHLPKKVSKVMTCVTASDGVAARISSIHWSMSTQAAKKKLKLAAKASIDHFTGKAIGPTVLTSKMRETATEPCEDGPTWQERSAPGEIVCWSASCWEPTARSDPGGGGGGGTTGSGKAVNPNLLQMTGKANIQAVVVGKWAGVGFPGAREGPYAREAKAESSDDEFIEDAMPEGADPSKPLDELPKGGSGAKVIRNARFVTTLNKRMVAFEMKQMAIEKKRAEREKRRAGLVEEES